MHTPLLIIPAVLWDVGCKGRERGGPGAAADQGRDDVRKPVAFITSAGPIDPSWAQDSMSSAPLMSAGIWEPRELLKTLQTVLYLLLHAHQPA